MDPLDLIFKSIKQRLHKFKQLSSKERDIHRENIPNV